VAELVFRLSVSKRAWEAIDIVMTMNAFGILLEDARVYNDDADDGEPDSLFVDLREIDRDDPRRVRFVALDGGPNAWDARWLMLVGDEEIPEELRPRRR
jgi:hypothetical protein